MLNTNSEIAKLALGFHIFIVCSLQIIIALNKISAAEDNFPI